MLILKKSNSHTLNFLEQIPASRHLIVNINSAIETLEQYVKSVQI